MLDAQKETVEQFQKMEWSLTFYKTQITSVVVKFAQFPTRGKQLLTQILLNVTILEALQLIHKRDVDKLPCDLT